MDHTTALDRLPGLYGRALLLWERGGDAEGIAAELGVEPESVGPMLRLATAKLADLLGEPTVPPAQGG